MYEHFRDSSTPNDIERTLKMMLLVDNGPELPTDAVKSFYNSFSSDLADDMRVWFLGTRAAAGVSQRELCRGTSADRVSALVLEQDSPNAAVKVLALAVRSLTFARQKDAAQARTSPEQVKQIMSQDLRMTWNAKGVDGTTILNGVTVEHDKLIPEIIRREAEQLIQSAAGPSPSKPPAK